MRHKSLEGAVGLIIAMGLAFGSVATAQSSQEPSVAEAARRAREQKSGAAKPTQVITNDTLPPAVNDRNLDGHTSTRFTAHTISIAPGDMLTLRGTPDGDEAAPVDYIEITPVTKETPQP